MLNFVGFINDNWDVPAAKKLAMLNSFCEQYNYEEFIEDEDGELIPNPVSKSQFTNQKITAFIRESVNAARWKVGRDAVEIEELVLE